MRKKRLLIVIFLGLLLALAAAGVWLFTADLGVFKGTVESVVSKQLGRDLNIDGELHVHLGEHIEITASNVRLANPGWATEPEFATVDSLSGRVLLDSLLNPPIIIESLEINGASVNLEANEDGKGTWVFELPPSKDTGPKKKTGFPVVFRHIELQGLALGFGRVGSEPTLSIKLDELKQSQRPDDMMELTVTGRLNDAPITYSGDLGPFDNLISGRDLQFNGKGQFGNLQVTGKGSVDSLVAPRQPVFDLRLNGPSLGEIAQTLGLPDPGDKAYTVTAVAKAEGDQLRMSVEAKIGDMVLDLRGLSAGITDFSTIDYQVAAHGPDLGAITSFFQLGQWPREPFIIDGAVQRQGENLVLQDIAMTIGSTQFALGGTLSSFPNLHNAEAELHVSGGDVARFRELIGVKGTAEGDFEISVKLHAREDDRDIVEAFVETELGKILINGEVGPGPDYAGSTMEVKFDGSNAKKLMEAYGINGFREEPFGIDAKFDIEKDGFRFERGVMIHLDEDRIEIEGFLSRQPLEGNTNIHIKASGGDITQFIALSGKDLPIPIQPYSLESGFRVTPAGFRIDGLTGTVGPNDLALDGLITRVSGLVGTDLTFSLGGPDLETLIKDTAGFDVPAQDFSSSGHLRLLEDHFLLENFAIKVGGMDIGARVQATLPFNTAKLDFDVHAKGPDVNVVLPEFEQFTPHANPFEVRTRGSVDNGAWVVEEGHVSLADATLDFSGSIDLFPEISDTDFQVALNVPRPASLATLTRGTLPEYAVEFIGQLTGEPGHAKANNLTARLGNSDFAGNFSYSVLGEIPELELSLKSNLIDLVEMLGGPADDAQPDPERPPPADGRVIPDYAFPFEKMKSITARVLLEGDRVTNINRTFENFRFDASLRDGGLVIRDARGEGLEGYFKLNLSLQPKPGGPAELDVDFELSGLVLNLSRDDNVKPDDLPKINVELKAKGKGNDLRSVAASMTGHLNADSPGGIVPDSMISVLDKGVFEQIFGLILPKTEESQTTDLQCFAARLTMTDGQVQAAPGVAIVTDKVQMTTRGTINLQTEKLDLNFETHPTKAYQANVSEVLINPFVKIGGTLGQPQAELAAGKAILFGGAAAATGGLSILAKGLFDRMTMSADPCAEFIESGKK
jgi:uncharacterized protein involved in outer membrane biogenesis